MSVKVGSFMLRNISFKIPNGSWMVILGPTGSGKTTLLESIAGLRQIIGGQVFIDDTEITNLPPEKRNISMVFQNLALFPHLTVYENIEYGLLARGFPRNVREERVSEMLKLFGLEHLKNRYVTNLSGGEKQRVALARALAVRPKVILLDEPFSSLDLVTRKQFWKEIKKLLKYYEIPVLHVTHDQEEAMYLGEMLAVMKNGTIIEQGLTGQIFSKPKSKFVAEFLQYQNIFTGIAKSSKDNMSTIFIDNVKLTIPGKHDGRIMIGIKPENILISKTMPERSTSRNVLKGSIEAIEPSGPTIMITVNVNNLPIKIMITRGFFEELELKQNDIIYLIIKAASIIVLSE
ncbi:MAG: ABC transporter ATP-binding protein [Thermoprotei archaeon]